jgi:hypothetical protein
MPLCGLCDEASWPNSCNVNLYEDGAHSVGWHVDDEELFGGKAQAITIISSSLGGERSFELRPTRRTRGEQACTTQVMLKDGRAGGILPPEKLADATVRADNYADSVVSADLGEVVASKFIGEGVARQPLAGAWVHPPEAISLPPRVVHHPKTIPHAVAGSVRHQVPRQRTPSLYQLGCGRNRGRATVPRVPPTDVGSHLPDLQREGREGTQVAGQTTNALPTARAVQDVGASTVHLSNRFEPLAEGQAECDSTWDSRNLCRRCLVRRWKRHRGSGRSCRAKHGASVAS